MDRQRLKRVKAFIEKKGIKKYYPFLRNVNGNMKTVGTLEDMLYEFSTSEVELIKKEEIIKLQRDIIDKNK